MRLLRLLNGEAAPSRVDARSQDLLQEVEGLRGEVRALKEALAGLREEQRVLSLRTEEGVRQCTRAATELLQRLGPERRG